MPDQNVQLINKEDNQETVDLKETVNQGSSIPTGVILMWSGTIATIPTGWAICDGNNGTPNLLDKFIIGVATAGTDPADGGGSHTLTSSNASDLTGDSGTDQVDSLTKQHTHTIDLTGAKHYRLAFIMKT